MASLANCSFGPSGEDKREEVFIISEEKQKDPFTAIMLQEEECQPHLYGPPRCSTVTGSRSLSPQGYQPSLKLFLVLGKRGREGSRGAKSDCKRGGVCVRSVLLDAFEFVSLFVHAIHRRLQFKTLSPFLRSPPSV